MNITLKSLNELVCYLEGADTELQENVLWSSLEKTEDI